MTSLVFPGQGSQYVGMAKDFYDSFETARNIFELVEDSTKIKVKEIIFEDSNNLLNITKYTQICVYTASMAIYSVFYELFMKQDQLDINFSLGHSLGEYGALTASQSIDIGDCAKLLKIRGELMQDSFEENKSGMSAVIGLDCQTLENIIKENSIDIEIANDNSPVQVVISGIIENIKNSEKILISKGAKKIVSLNVSAAFHSKLMSDAEYKMKEYLTKINFKDPIFPIISNYTGNDSVNKSVILQNLSNQMSNKVKWLDSIKLIENSNETTIIEIGPGKVLTGLINRISKKFICYNINEIGDMDTFRDAI